jgi:hypothetical protein
LLIIVVKLNTLHMENKNSKFWIDYDFFSPDDDSSNLDYIALSSYKRAISNFVNIVTGESIKVNFNVTGDSYTDGKTVTISSKINETDFDPIVGLALHEGSHIKLTDFETLNYINNAEYVTDYSVGSYWRSLYQKYNTDSKNHINNVGGFDIKHFCQRYVSPKLKDIVNVIEDRRIDWFIYSTSPGYKGYYQAMYDKYFNAKQIDKGLLSSEYRTEEWDSYFFRLINITNKHRDLGALSKLRLIWNMLDLKNISRLKNTWDVVDLALSIFKVIESVIKVDNSNSSNDGSDSEQSNDSDDSDQSTGGGGSDGDGSDGSDSEQSNDGDSDGSDGGGSDGDGSDNGNTTTAGNGNLSDRQKQLLDKAIKKQKDFIDGSIKKRKISKSDSKKINAIDENGVDSKMCGGGNHTRSDFNKSKTGNKTNVTIVRNFSKKLIESGLLGYALVPHDSNSWRTHRADEHQENIIKGTQLGTMLGRRLKQRSEERSLVTPRMKNGRISGRLMHELGSGNYNVFNQIQIDKRTPSLVHLSVDASGSMSGKRWKNAQTAVVAIAKAASMTTNLDVVISYRTTYSPSGSSYGGNDDTPLVIIAYDSRKDKFSKITQLFKYIDCTGTTPEGLCFEAIMKDIINVGGNLDKYFINFSDGCPQFQNSNINYVRDYAISHTKKQVDMIRNNGIKVLSYFITDTYGAYHFDTFSKMYGKDSVNIDVKSLIPLAKSLNKFFQ